MKIKNLLLVILAVFLTASVNAQVNAEYAYLQYMNVVDSATVNEINTLENQINSLKKLVNQKKTDIIRNNLSDGKLIMEEEFNCTYCCEFPSKFIYNSDIKFLYIDLYEDSEEVTKTIEYKTGDNISNIFNKKTKYFGIRTDEGTVILSKNWIIL